MTSPEPAASRQNRLLVVLADISGYTELMVASQTAAVHGQVVVSLLLEAILKEVDIPLHLQEIEGDAVFLYAEHPGSEEGWREVCAHVAARLPRFFEAFAEAMVTATESTLCPCGICQSDELRLKVVVHSGEAVFHQLAGRPQVSGVDVILAHRLLKNSVPGSEYILLTEPAHRDLAPTLALELTPGEEHYEGLGTIPTFVHFPGDHPEVRRRFYAQSPAQLTRRGLAYAAWVIATEARALLEHLRRPVTSTSTPGRIAYAALMVLGFPFVFVMLAVATPVRLLVRRGRFGEGREGQA